MLYRLSTEHVSKRSPWSMFALILVGLAVALLGIAKLQLDVDFNDYFSKNDPRFSEYQLMQSKFAREDDLILLLESDDSWQSQSADIKLTEFIALLYKNEIVSHVGGYAQFQASNNPQHALLSYKQHPRLNAVLSPNQQAILLTLTLSTVERSNYASNSQWLLQQMHRVDSFSHEYWQNDNVEIHFSGTQALNWQYIKVLSHDLRWFAPGVLAVWLLMAFLYIRQWPWLLGLFCSNVIILLLTLGLAGWFGLTIAAISAFVPVIIVTLSLAYTSHLYQGWKQGIAKQLTNLQAIAYSLKHNQQALFYASLTTMLGFGLLWFSPSPPIQSFGVMVAFAVFINYLLSISLVLWFAQFSTPKYESKTTTHPLFKYVQRVSNKPKTMLALVLVTSLLSIWSVSKLKLEDDPLHYFPEQNTFNIASQKMYQHFSGINIMYFDVHTQPYAISDKAYLQFIIRLGRFLNQQPQVERVEHIGDWLKSSGLTQSQFKRVTSRTSVEELGLLSEISADYQSSLVTLYLKDIPSSETLLLEQNVNTWIANYNANLVQPIKVSSALGSGVMFAHLSADNAKSMLWSFGVALIVLATLLSIIKHSMWFGLIGLLINFLPLLWVFGLWQWFGGFIGLGSTVVLGIMLGIIVDDTLHLMLKLPNVGVDDKDDNARLNNFWPAFERVLSVVSFTTVTLVLGFSIGLMSDFSPITQLSVLSCMVLLLAWWFDVFVLPALYGLLIKKRGING